MDKILGAPIQISAIMRWQNEHYLVQCPGINAAAIDGILSILRPLPVTPQACWPV